MSFSLGNKVKIIGQRYLDGLYDVGKVIGVELVEDAYYLGYKDKNEFFNRFKIKRYKVAYIVHTTNRAEVNWFSESELSK